MSNSNRYYASPLTHSPQFKVEISMPIRCFPYYKYDWLLLRISPHPRYCYKYCYQQTPTTDKYLIYPHHMTTTFVDCSGEKFSPNVVVSKGGDGKFTTLTDAVTEIPSSTKGRCIKSGVYEEIVTISRPVTLIGDSKGKTIIRSRLNMEEGVNIQFSGALSKNFDFSHIHMYCIYHVSAISLFLIFLLFFMCAFCFISR